VLITRYLDYSLPYHLLFMQPEPGNGTAGTFLMRSPGCSCSSTSAESTGGDCSLVQHVVSPRRGDAASINLVDAETSEVHPHVAPGLRSTISPSWKKTSAGP